jgi:hypothetical protein
MFDQPEELLFLPVLNTLQDSDFADVVISLVASIVQRG